MEKAKAVTMQHVCSHYIIYLIAVVLLNGCADILSPTIQSKIGWKAEQFFDDPKVVELCHAIERNDIKEVEKLIKDGVNINTAGRGNMTPLFWAYPGDHLQIFKLLLAHGADPNVIISKDVWELTRNAKSWMKTGAAVTHYSCMTWRSGYFEAVFDYGGDPNLLAFNGKGGSPTPLFMVIDSDAGNKVEKVSRLIDLGANVDYMIEGGGTPLRSSVVSRRSALDVTLLLLKAGADYKKTYYKGRMRLIHELAQESERKQSWWNSQEKRNYFEVVKWLEKHGESMDAARADIERWRIEATLPTAPKPSAFN
ncbi:hypothetical protein K2Y11_01820 [bacterium]|nr:hypothetical protein [bacterium]